MQFGQSLSQFRSPQQGQVAVIQSVQFGDFNAAVKDGQEGSAAGLGDGVGEDADEMAVLAGWSGGTERVGQDQGANHVWLRGDERDKGA